MKTKYISKHINEYKQLNIYTCLCEIREKCNYKFYRIAQYMIDELYEIYCECKNDIYVSKYDDININYVVFTFDDECEMFLLIERIAKHINK